MHGQPYIKKKIQIHRVEFWGPHSRSGPGGREIRACGSPQISIPFRSMLSFGCRTTSFRMAVTAYTVYSQLPSVPRGRLFHPQPDAAQFRGDSNVPAMDVRLIAPD